MTFWEAIVNDKEELARYLIETELKDGELRFAAPVAEDWPGEVRFEYFDEYDNAIKATVAWLNSEIEYKDFFAEDEEVEKEEE